MVDLVIPPALDQAQVSFRYVDPSGASTSRYTGAIQTTSYGGDRVGAVIDFSKCGGGSATGASRRGQLKAFLMELKGRQGRAYLTDVSSPIRGSFPATELFSNSEFASGTTGWLSTSRYTLTAADGIIRATVAEAPGVTGRLCYQLLSPLAYTPYVVRAILRRGRQATPGYNYGVIAHASASTLSASDGYVVVSHIPSSTSAAVSGAHGSTTAGQLPGDYVDILFLSASRCMLVDGGGNLLLRSDDITTTWSSIRSSDIADSTTAPDGTTTADSLVEDSTASNSHYVQQVLSVSAAAQDYTFSVYLKANTRTNADIRIVENDANTAAAVGIDLTNGVTSGLTAGANWSDARAFVVNAGGGWYRVTIVGRKTNSATSLSLRIVLADSSGSTTYSGDGSSSIYVWRASCRQDSLPSRGAATTTAAATAESQTGSVLHVKGLPVSTSGLLLPGDWVEIDGQLKMVTSSLNSDASGLGHLRFSPPLRRAVADNTPVIVCRPMGRFMYPGDSLGWNNEPGLISSAQIELVEAFAA